MLENAARREGHDRGAGREARRLGGRALPAFREQGADVRRADRVHRDDAVHADQQDRQPRRPTASRRRSRSSRVLLGFAEKNPGMTRVLIGDALVNEDERLQARINQLYDRIEAALRQSLRIAQAAGNWPGDPAAEANVLLAFVLGPLAAVREDRLQARAAGGLGAAAQVPVRLSATRARRRESARAACASDAGSVARAADRTRRVARDVAPRASASPARRAAAGGRRASRRRRRAASAPRPPASRRRCRPAARTRPSSRSASPRAPRLRRTGSGSRAAPDRADRTPRPGRRSGSPRRTPAACSRRRRRG